MAHDDEIEIEEVVEVENGQVVGWAERLRVHRDRIRPRRLHILCVALALLSALLLALVLFHGHGRCVVLAGELPPPVIIVVHPPEPPPVAPPVVVAPPAVALPVHHSPVHRVVRHVVHHVRHHHHHCGG